MPWLESMKQRGACIGSHYMMGKNLAQGLQVCKIAERASNGCSYSQIRTGPNTRTHSLSTDARGPALEGLRGKKQTAARCTLRSCSAAVLSSTPPGPDCNCRGNAALASTFAGKQQATSPSQHNRGPLGGGTPKPTPDAKASAVSRVSWSNQITTSSQSDKHRTSHRVRRPTAGEEAQNVEMADCDTPARLTAGAQSCNSQGDVSSLPRRATVYKPGHCCRNIQAKKPLLLQGHAPQRLPVRV